MNGRWEFLQFWQDSNGRNFEIRFRIPRTTQGHWHEIQFIAEPIEEGNEELYFSFRVTDTAAFTREELKGRQEEFLLDAGLKHFLLWLDNAEISQKEPLMLESESSMELYNPNISHLRRREHGRAKMDALLTLETTFFDREHPITENELISSVYCSQDTLKQVLGILEEQGFVKTLGDKRWTITHKGLEHLEEFESAAIMNEIEITNQSDGSEEKTEWDIFICHASEDKDEVVRELAQTLTDEGLEVWYDEFTLKWGDSLRQEIEKGLRLSRFGLVIISKAFFNKRWPQEELDGLFSLEYHGATRILPLWHKITVEEVTQYSPILAGRLAKQSDEGIPTIVEAVKSMINQGENKSVVLEPLGDPNFDGETFEIVIRYECSIGEIEGNVIFRIENTHIQDQLKLNRVASGEDINDDLKKDFLNKTRRHISDNLTAVTRSLKDKRRYDLTLSMIAESVMV